MPTATSILSELKKKGSAQTRKIYARHGMNTENMYGVSMAELKVFTKRIKGQQALACELYETGNFDAMYLAGLVADGAQLSVKQLDDWAHRAEGMRMISEYTIPWVATDNPLAREMALKWIASKEEHIASSGWRTYAVLLSKEPDENLDFAEIQELLNRVVKEIKSAPNRLRYNMNSFVISVGSYVKPLLKPAKDAARKIGAVSVDVGETDCKVPLATAYIEKVEAAGRVGRKVKTLRC
jgi:3-methyladenine DNA glycosylase AlkD